MIKTTTRNSARISDAIGALESFTTSGSLSGGMALPGSGQLPDEWRGLRRMEDITYDVRSYATPIAWYDAKLNVWVMPDVRYSVTTSRQQSTVTLALYWSHADVVTDADKYRAMKEA